MLQPQTVHHNAQTTVTQALLPWHKPFLSGDGRTASFPIFRKPISEQTTKKSNSIRTRRDTRSIKAVFQTTEKITQVKAIVTVTPTAGGALERLTSAITTGLDDISDLFGKGLQLELVAAELDPQSGNEKPTIKAYAGKKSFSRDAIEFEVNFDVPQDFGEIGAIMVENEHHKEMFMDKIVLDGFDSGPIIFPCQSWVAPKSEPDHKRIFFSTKGW